MSHYGHPDYELLRPIVLFGQPTEARARETGVSARTLRRKAARFAAVGMRSLFETEAEDATTVPDRRLLPLGIRRAIVKLKAGYPPFTVDARFRGENLVAPSAHLRPKARRLRHTASGLRFTPFP